MMFGGGGLVVCNGGLFRCRGEEKKRNRGGEGYLLKSGKKIQK